MSQNRMGSGCGRHPMVLTILEGLLGINLRVLSFGCGFVLKFWGVDSWNPRS